jgi:hypothetical protein
MNCSCLRKKKNTEVATAGIINKTFNAKTIELYDFLTMPFSEQNLCVNFKYIIDSCDDRNGHKFYRINFCKISVESCNRFVQTQLAM